MKRIGNVLLLTACVIGLHCSLAAAQSGTTGDVPAVSSPIMESGIYEGPAESAMEPIPAQSYAGEVVGGSSCCNGGATGVPVYQPYSTGYWGNGYYPTYRTGWNYGYRPLFGGVFSRRNVYYCCP